jgi:hypothetical protein
VGDFAFCLLFALQVFFSRDVPVHEHMAGSFNASACFCDGFRFLLLKVNLLFWRDVCVRLDYQLSHEVDLV